MHEALALGVGELVELRPFDAGFRCKTFQRLGRLAVGIERDVEVGTQHFRSLLGLLGRDARQQHRDAARRVERFGIAAFNRHAALLQRREHAVEESLRKPGQGLDRQFLGAEFDQERLHCGHAESLCFLTPSPACGGGLGWGLIHRERPHPPFGHLPPPAGEGIRRPLSSIPENPTSRAARSKPSPPPAPARARAGCSAGVR